MSILDLHVHSRFSLDSPTKIEDYARRLIELRKDFTIDGFVLMEHNYLVSESDCDLAELSSRHGITILAGVEVDTFWGHALVYGMTASMWKVISSSTLKKQEPHELARMAVEEGAALVPAHPYRFFIGMGDRAAELPGVSAVETLNGSNEKMENQLAGALALRMGWAATGGSDAHFVPEFGKCLTEFDGDIRAMSDLVSAIREGRTRALALDEARRG